jgi:NADH:ubiquinone oxidoreductase subunit 4 (subunit M)
MNISAALGTHGLPLWFLVFSLFLPRIAIVIAWLQHSLPAYVPTTVNLLQIIIAVLIPRILILFWIYQDQGVSLWLLIHAIGLIVAWGGGSGTYVRRRRIDVTD